MASVQVEMTDNVAVSSPLNRFAGGLAIVTTATWSVISTWTEATCVAPSNSGET